MTTRTTLLAATACCAALALSACGQSSTTTATSATTSPTTSSAAGGASSSGAAVPTPNGKTFSAEGLEISKTWVKAIPDIAKGKMTGVFGTIKNTTGKEILITGGSQDASSRTELHETAMVNGSMQMRPIKDGFRIPAGGTFELKPGGNHIMVMDMTEPLPAGATLKVTLTTQDGKKLPFEAVAWAFPGGGNEPYANPSASTSK